jgi:hypothetical protein
MIDVIVGPTAQLRTHRWAEQAASAFSTPKRLIVVRRVSKLFVTCSSFAGRDIAITIPIGFYLQDM